MKALAAVSRWLYPGLGVKRWLLLLGLGITFVGLGVAYLLVHLYRAGPFPEPIWYVTLQFFPRPLRGIVFMLIGFAVTGISIYKLNRSILSALIPKTNGDLWDALYKHSYLKSGPRIVAIGGGTGLSTLLRGLKEYTEHITAIVTVADDGGSSGRLRRELGILPPGDFRQCIVALADVEPLMTKLFQYRFGEGSGLEGHSFGNLFIAAMSAITGNFESALQESSRVLAVRGQVLPSTLSNVTLCAEFDDQVVVSGEHLITERRRPIRQVFLDPPNVPGYPEAARAIERADLIVIGPGSLYTSVIPNLLVKDIANAVRRSKAIKIYVCNVAAQAGETDGFSVGDHVRTLASVLGEDVFDYVLANRNLRAVTARGSKYRPVRLDRRVNPNQRHRVVLADLVDTNSGRLHDPVKLAQSIIRLCYERHTPEAGHHGGENIIDQGRQLSDATYDTDDGFGSASDEH
ncbi:MAG: gluconeogenesis factor YvcK family protein [Chloroflexota bacterium]